MHDQNTPDPAPFDSTAEIFPVVYEELRSLAASKLSMEESPSFQPTELVHEAYLRLKKGREGGFENRWHFFAAAGEAMRRILVDRARRRNARKRGGGAQPSALSDPTAPDAPDPVDILAIDEALRKLELQDPRGAQLVKLRYFAGLSINEAAQALGVSSTTVDNDWAYIKTWLKLEIHGRSDGTSPTVADH